MEDFLIIPKRKYKTAVVKTMERAEKRVENGSGKRRAKKAVTVREKGSSGRVRRSRRKQFWKKGLRRGQNRKR